MAGCPALVLCFSLMNHEGGALPSAIFGRWAGCPALGFLFFADEPRGGCPTLRDFRRVGEENVRSSRIEFPICIMLNRA